MYCIIIKISSLQLKITKVKIYMKLGTKKPKTVTKPVKSITELTINKELNTELKNRSVNKKLGKYKRNKTKEIKEELKKLNKTTTSKEFHYFDGKKINKFNLNILELQNIHKLLPPKDKKILKDITAEISLRISREIRRKRIVFKDNFGEVAKMTPNYLLSLPLNKIEKLITPYEYKKLFEIAKRIPEKNINFILKNYESVKTLQTKNRFLAVSTILVKTGLASIKGLFENKPKANVQKKEIPKTPKKSILNKKSVTDKYPLYQKIYVSKISKEERRQKLNVFGEKYFSRIEKLLSKYTQKEKITTIPTNIISGIERIVEDSLTHNKSIFYVQKRYNKLISENKK